MHIPPKILAFVGLQRHSTKNTKTNIPRKGIVRSRSLPRLVRLFCCRKICTLENVNRSQTHECGNWDWGRAFLFWEYLNRIFVALCATTCATDYVWLVAGDRLAVHRARLTQQADATWQADLPPQVNRKTDLPIGTHLDCLNNHF